MARLIKELILGDNLLLALLAVSVLIITLLIFQFAAKRNFGIFLEKSFAILYIFISCHVNVPPFNYLHFINIASTGGGTVNQLPYVFYPWLMFVLSGRFVNFFKNKFTESLSYLFLRNPGFSLYCMLPIISSLWSLVPDITLKAGLAFTGFTIFG
ncbi:MAG: O-antigen ligase family protein, partial [Cyanobacteriota bacterium]|nr:O-antigen ligase family protein [Cyanobacteriota bacterium]